MDSPLSAPPGGTVARVVADIEAALAAPPPSPLPLPEPNRRHHRPRRCRRPDTTQQPAQEAVRARAAMAGGGGAAAAASAREGAKQNVDHADNDMNDDGRLLLVGVAAPSTVPPAAADATNACDPPSPVTPARMAPACTLQSEPHAPTQTAAACCPVPDDDANLAHAVDTVSNVSDAETASSASAPSSPPRDGGCIITDGGNDHCCCCCSHSGRHCSHPQDATPARPDVAHPSGRIPVSSFSSPPPSLRGIRRTHSAITVANAGHPTAHQHLPNPSRPADKTYARPSLDRAPGPAHLGRRVGEESARPRRTQSFIARKVPDFKALHEKLPPTAQPLSVRLNLPTLASDGAQSPPFGSIARSPRLESLSTSSSFTVARRSMFMLGAFPPSQRQPADAGSGESDLEPLSPPSALPALPPVHPRSAPRPRLVRANSTIPKPFRLPGERFHEKAVADLEEKRRHSETVETSPRLYKARPMPDFSHDPRRRPPCRITE